MSQVNLYDQLSTQVNFLLLNQRNMILISAFSVALASFRANHYHFFIKYFVIFLFVYALAVGFVSVEDFKAFLKEVRKTETNLNDSEKDLLNRYERWTYFTYALIGLIILMLLTFTQIEFFDNFHKAIKLRK